MSFIKSQLKVAREAIQSKSFEYAQSVCESIIENDPTNYNAYVFLGLSLYEQDELENAVRVYQNGIKLQPQQPLAYQGLLKAFEKLNDTDGQLDTLEKMGDIYISLNDGKKFLESLEKRIELCKTAKDSTKLISLLGLYLPDSNIYHLISDLNLPSQSEILMQCIQMTELDLKQTINDEINKRRMRLGADSLAVIRFKVEGEYITTTPLNHLYNQLLSLDLDDELRMKEQSNYLQFLNRKLQHVTGKEKQQSKNDLFSLAISLLNAPAFSSLAYQIVIESEDQSLESRNESLLRRFMEFCTDENDVYRKFVNGYFQWKSEEDAVEILQDVQEGVESFPDSLFGTQLLLKLAVLREDWANVIENGQNLKKIAQDYSSLMELPMDNVILETELAIGKAYLQLGDEYTSQCLTIYQNLLHSSPNHFEVLMGLGCCLVQIGKADQAKQYFETASQKYPNSLAPVIEIAWTLFLLNDFNSAADLLQTVPNPTDSFLVQYRLARIYWELNGEYRSDKNYTHIHLIRAIKLNPNFSSSFTYLGHYYRLQENDINRATKCYSKAINTNPKDDDAIRAIVQIWLNQHKVKESQELLIQFVSLVPRSKWAWKQLGIVCLHLGQVADAILYFQTALRIISKDVICWTSLGEAYFLEGKYMAALKALDRSIILEPNQLFGYYLKGLVSQKLALYQESSDAFNYVLNEMESQQCDQLELIPTLIGLANTLVMYSKELFDSGSFGASFSQLINAVGICKKSLEFEHEMVETMSKLLGDASFQIYQLSNSLIDQTTASSFRTILSFLETKFGDTLQEFGFCNNETDIKADIDYVLQCSAFSYQLCIYSSHSPLVKGSFYHDLAKVYYERHLLSGIEDLSPFLSLAIQYTSIALKTDPESWIYWNSLGVLLHRINPKLSQHAFIKSIELNPQNGSLWSNLGYLYIINNDLDLAIQCFQKSQFHDPDFSLGWLGQAFVGDTLGSDEAFSLFEHAHELGKANNLETLYGFAKQCYINPDKHPLSITNGCFALLKCTEMKVPIPAVYNLYGLFLEQQGRVELAIDAFENALQLAETDTKTVQNAISENLARCYCSNKNFEKSIEHFQNVIDTHGDAYTWIGYGIALYFDNRFQDSILAFENALQHCNSISDNVQLINDTTLMLSQVLYALGTPDHIELCKQQLLQCFANDSQFVRAIIGLAAMGLVMNDWDLAQTAAAELLGIAPHILSEWDVDVDIILYHMFLLQGETTQAKRFLVKSVHRYPHKAERWTRLAEHAFTYDPRTTLDSIAWSSQSIASHTHPNLQTDLSSVTRFSKIQLTAGISTQYCKTKSRTARSCLSKAILMTPSNPFSWIALSLELESHPEDNSDKRESDLKLSNVCAQSAQCQTDNLEVAKWTLLLSCNSVIKCPSLQYEDYLSSCLQTIDSITSNSEGLLRQVGYTLLGNVLFLMGNLNSSVIAMKQAIIQSSDILPWITPMHILSHYYFQSGLTDSAITCLDFASTQYSDIESLLLLVNLQLKSGRDQHSLEKVNQVLKIEPDSIVAKFFQTYYLGKLDVKKNMSRITKNKTLLKEHIDPTIYDWLESQ